MYRSNSTSLVDCKKLLKVLGFGIRWRGQLRELHADNFEGCLEKR